MEVVSPISMDTSFASNNVAPKQSDMNNNPSASLPMTTDSSAPTGQGPSMEDVKATQPNNSSSAISNDDGAGMDVSHHDETLRVAAPPAATTASPNKDLPAPPPLQSTLASVSPSPTTAPAAPQTAVVSDSTPSAFKPFDVSQIMNAPPMANNPTPTGVPSPSVSPMNPSPGLLPASMLNSLPFHMQQHIQASLSPSLPSDAGVHQSNTQSQQQQATGGQSSFLPSSILLGSSASSSSSGTPSLADANQGALVRTTSFEKGTKYIDLTDYLALPQTEAARRLGIPTSTLSKRWKEAVVNRKWPYRMVCKLNKEIMTLLHNVPQGPGAPPLPAEIEQSLGILLRRRQEELRGVVIRV